MAAPFGRAGPEVTSLSGRTLVTTGLVLAAFLMALPAHAVDVEGTTARLGWTASAGPVSVYGVFLSKNGGPYPSSPNQVVTSQEVTITGAVGDTYVVKTAAYDTAGTKGPESQPSAPIVFVAAPGTPPPPEPSPEPAPGPAPSTPPALSVPPTALSVSVVQGQDASPQSFTVSNAGGGTLGYLLANSQSWIVLGARSGTATTETDTIPVSFATSSMAPGSYAGVITVVQSDPATSPQTEKYVLVNLTVTAASAPQPAIALSTASLAATATKGQNPASQSFSLRNSGGGTLGYSVTDNASWLSVSPASGTSSGEADAVAVSFSTESLAAGSYNAAITVSGGTGVAPAAIAVSLVVKDIAPEISVSTTSISTRVQQGGNPPPGSFAVRNSGGGTLSYSVTPGAGWLSVSPGSGTSTGESDTIGVACNTAGMPAGTHDAVVTVSGSGVAAKTVAVSVTIDAREPVLEVSTTTLDATGAPGQSVADQGFTVRNAGGGNLAYSVASDESWLTVTPTSGSSTGEADTLQVKFAAENLADGTHEATLTVTAPGLPPETIAVTLRLRTTAARFDLDGDGSSDAMFRHADGSLAAWLMNGTSVRQSVTPASENTRWELVGAGDFDGDGKTFDLLWMNPKNGRVMITVNDGATQRLRRTVGTVNPAWRVGAVADFDGDGQSDVLWIDPVTGDVGVWLVSDARVSQGQLVGTVGTDWNVVGAGDFDGDQKADVLFERASSCERVLWLMDGLSVRSSYPPAAPKRYPFSVASAGDYNGDGLMDVAAAYTDTSFALLTATAAGFADEPYLVSSLPTAYIAGSGDHDGDGSEDMLWFVPQTGGVWVGLVGAGRFDAVASAGALGPNWKIVGSTGTADTATSNGRAVSGQACSVPR